MLLGSFNTTLQVLSSIIAAWSDVSATLGDSVPITSIGLSLESLKALPGVVSRLNIGYLWMLINCATSAAYVRYVISSLTSQFYTHLSGPGNA